MPVYNGEKYLKEAIESVLNQTFKNFELIIINDGSIDQTSKIIEEFAKRDTRIVTIQNFKNLGLQESLKIGIAASRGELIARLDYDDYWIDAAKLEKQIAHFEKYLDCVVVGTWVTLIDASGSNKGLLKRAVNDEAIRASILRSNEFTHSSVVFRKSTLSKAGGSYNSYYRYTEDLELWLRMGMVGKLANIPEFLTAYRTTGQNVSMRKRQQQLLECLKIIIKFRRCYPNAISAFIATLAKLSLNTIIGQTKY